jgi:hypothetical protein
MADTPRLRRLRADRRSLEQLKADSSIFDFAARGEAPDTYSLFFNGRGVWRPDASASVTTVDRHEVYLRLGAAYPRMMPELTWRSPIFHPNISASGVVCLGGYGTYWVPSLSLDELCTMLWDMIRYANYDPNSPYNRDAALWAKNQSTHPFPLDNRPIRNLISRQARPAPVLPEKREAPAPLATTTASPVVTSPRAAASAVLQAPPPSDIVFLDSTDIVEAEVLDDSSAGAASGEPEIVFID